MRGTAEARTAERRARATVATRITTGIKAALVIALLAGCAFVALNLARGTSMVTPVLSGSMRPGFAVGGVVISQRTRLKDITVGDVIVFQNPVKRTEQMIHRIIKLTHEPGGAIEIKTKGDANPVPDPWTVVIKTRFVYRIRWSVPLVGYLAVAYQNYRAQFVMAAGLLLLLSGASTWLRVLRRSRAAAEEPEPEVGEPVAHDESLGARPLHLVSARISEPAIADAAPQDVEASAASHPGRADVGAPR